MSAPGLARRRSNTASTSFHSRLLWVVIALAVVLVGACSDDDGADDASSDVTVPTPTTVVTAISGSAACVELKKLNTVFRDGQVLTGEDMNAAVNTVVEELRANDAAKEADELAAVAAADGSDFQAFSSALTACGGAGG